MKNKPSKSVGLNDVGNVPNVAYEKARQQWAERMGEPIVERNRWFLMALFLAFALLVSLLALKHLTPLKTVVPYAIKIDQDTGEIRGAPVEASKFVLGTAEKKYFISRWVRNIIDLEPRVTEKNLREAFGFVRGKAVDEYKDFMTKTRPLARLQEEKTLSRRADIVSIIIESENTANIRFVTEERQVGSAPVRQRYVAFITYEVVPPTTDLEMLENPLGIFITHFVISEEIK